MIESPALLEDDRSAFEQLVAPLARMGDEERAAMLAEALGGLSDDDLRVLMSWEGQGRPSQRISPDDHALLEGIIGGRGSGKTRSGAEAVCDRIEAGKLLHGAFISRTPGDVRRTMIEGPRSGFMVCAERRGIRAKHFPSTAEIRILSHGGGSISLYSAHQPEALRGPEHDTLWADEFAAWPDKRDEMGGTAFSNALLGLRLGDDPLGIFTTTPRATPQMREVMRDRSGLWRVRRMATIANAANLPPGYLPSLIRMWGGTRLYAQEVEGLYVEDVEGALWATARIEASRIHPADHVADPLEIVGLSEAELLALKIEIVERIAGGLPWRFVAVDPSFAEDGGGDECGIVVGGVGLDRRLYVLGDYSGNLAPEAWAARVVWAWETAGCQAAIVESNMDRYGVSKTLELADRRMPIEWVQARTTKRARAEPVATLWKDAPDGLLVEPHAIGSASIVGSLPGLEAECTGWDARSNVSPNRIDALAWLGWRCFELMFQGEASWSAEAGSWQFPT